VPGLPPHDRASTLEQLSAWLDGELDDAEIAALEQQIARDPTLREELDDLREVADMVRTHGRVQAPAGFQARVLQAVVDEPMPGAWRRWLLRPFGVPFEGLAVAAAALLVIAIGVGGKDVLQLGADHSAVPGVSAPVSAPRSRDTGAPIAPVPAPAVTAVGADGMEASGRLAEETPPPATRKAAASTGAAAVPTSALGTTDDLRPAGTADATAPPQAPATPGSAERWANTYSFQVLTSDTEVLASLLRLAGKYGATVEDAKGARVTGGALPPGPHTYILRLPSTVLAQFGDDINALGNVQVFPDNRMYTQSVMPVQVQIYVTSAPAVKAAPVAQ
jgi:negative regulator of sigma E activity